MKDLVDAPITTMRFFFPENSSVIYTTMAYNLHLTIEDVYYQTQNTCWDRTDTNQVEMRLSIEATKQFIQV